MDLWIDEDEQDQAVPHTRRPAANGPLDMTVTFVEFDKPMTVVPRPPRMLLTWLRRSRSLGC